MILYNVTINIEDDVHDRWLEWMRNEHLPAVMNTGKFLKYSMYRILDRDPEETGVTYSVQYTARTMEDYETYRDQHAPALQAETRKYFEGKFVAFRTLLQLEHEHQK